MRKSYNEQLKEYHDTGEWKQYCTKCGQELEDGQIGLINFTQMNHVLKGETKRSQCPALMIESCPHCGRDIDI